MSRLIFAHSTWGEEENHMVPIRRQLSCVVLSSTLVLVLTACGLTLNGTGAGFVGENGSGSSGNNGTGGSGSGSGSGGSGGTGGSGSGAGTAAVSISINGASQVTLSTQSQYTATVSGASNAAVTWAVNGRAGGSAAAGTISGTGLYTAPSALPQAANVTITATSVASPSTSQSMTVTLTAPQTSGSGGGTTGAPSVLVAVSGPTSVMLGAQAQYAATVTGSPDTAATWRVNGVTGGSAAAGMVSAAGLYTAPSTMPIPATVTITAVSVAEPAISQSMTVTLTASPASSGGGAGSTITVAVSGASSVTLGAPSQYDATVSGAADNAVTWTVNGVPGGNVTVGVISATGLYTAPDALPPVANVMITATSVTHPTCAQSITVGLVAPPTTPVSPPSTPSTESATSVTVSGQATVNLGAPVSYTASVAGTSNQAVTWSVSPAGSGSIDANGLYTPPSSVPAANYVTVTATSEQTLGISGILVATLLDPIPVISSATATAQSSGQTYLIDVEGDAFLQGANLLINGQPVTTTTVAANNLQTTVSGGSAQTVTILVQNPNPGRTQSAPVTISFGVVPVQTTTTAAARLLDQSTYGPTALSIQHVQQVGLQGYLNEQFAAAPTYFPPLPSSPPAQCMPVVNSSACVRSNWFQIALTANDQLRQRVVLALSEIVVASSYNGYPITPYINLLEKDAFTNYRQIMQDVTLSPNMGSFLNMLNSGAAPTGQIANENYARELMQLFSMGLDKLNEDGTVVTDSSGNPIPAYTELQVEALARALTGWTYANADGSAPANFQWTPNWDHLMVPVEMRHDTSAKVLLNGMTLPAGQSAEQDVNGALDDVFNHPNVGPFVCRQLIQRLVAGNPSPAYMKRVADVFADNGQGVRGDMKAVITAILLDPEARANDAQTGDALETNPVVDSGHLREPALWLMNVVRGMNAVPSNPDPSNAYPFINIGHNETYALGEIVFSPSTVFNFFPPDYVIPGTTLNAPEFGMEDTGSILPRLNAANWLLHVSPSQSNVSMDFSAAGPFGSKAADAGALVDYLGLIFMHSQMPTDMRTAIVNLVSTIPASSPEQRVTVATYLVITSSQYKIMH